MNPEHYQKLSAWINDKINSQRPNVQAAYDTLGLSPQRYRQDLLLAINQSRWIQHSLYPYLTDNQIDAAVEQMIIERYSND